MSRNCQKPYFTADQVEVIVSNFKTSSEAKNLSYDEELISSVREYIVKKKNEYENAILRGVLEGRYTFVVVDDLATYATQENTPLHALLGFDIEADNQTLAHSLTQIQIFGKDDATRIVRKATK